MWITVMFIIYLNGHSEIIYSQPEHRGACDKRRIEFNKMAVEAKAANQPIWSVNSACIPVDGDKQRTLQ